MCCNKRAFYFAGVLLLCAAGAAVFFAARPRADTDVQNGNIGGRSYPSANSTLNICVEAWYPGAGAHVLRDAVAFPIEHHVNGVEHMLHMSSHCSNDGRYTLNISFEPKTNPDIAQVLVQNRVTLALGAMPALVQREGVIVKKRTPHLAMLMSLTSPERRHDAVFMSNYAKKQIGDELRQLAGIADVVIFGERDSTLHVWLDPQRMAHLNITAEDVINAMTPAGIVGKPGMIDIEGQNVEVGAVGIGKEGEFPIVINPRQRLVEADKFGNIILRADANGNIVRLKDVARVEKAPIGVDNRAAVDDAPAVLIGVYPLPGIELTKLRDHLRATFVKLQGLLPEGVALEIEADFTHNLENPGTSPDSEYLRLDLILPDGASPERVFKTLEQASKTLRQLPEIQRVLTMDENPFDLPRKDAVILAVLKRDDAGKLTREQTAKAIRSSLKAELRDASIRICNPGGLEGIPADSYPVRLAVVDQRVDADNTLRTLAEKLVEKLNASGKLTDAAANTSLRPVSLLSIDVEAQKAAAANVSIEEFKRTLSAFNEPNLGNRINQIGSFWSVYVQIETKPEALEAKLKEAKVRNKHGELLPLSQIANVRFVSAPYDIDRFDMHQSVTITANLEAGVALDEAQKLCESLAAEVGIEKNFRLEWIEQRPKE